MTVKTGAAWAGTFVTLDATGAKATPSVGPAGTLYVDGTANAAAVTITGANPYKFAVTLPALTAGQRVDMYITATISLIATAAVVASEQADTYLISDIEALVDDIGVAGAGLTAIPSIGSVTGAVGSIAAGGIASNSFALGAIDEDAIAANAIGSSELAPSAIDEIVDQVWDELIAGHAIAGSTGATLATAASAGGATPASLWAYASRTLTQSAAQVADIVSGSSITIQRGDTLSAALTGLGAITGYTTLDFTVKFDKANADTDAIIRIRKNASGVSDGLIRLNGAAATTAADGSITIDDLAAGNITIAMIATDTDDLIPGQGYYYDVQKITGTTVLTMTTGTFNVAADVTRLVA